jgi:hypothetical protein
MTTKVKRQLTLRSPEHSLRRYTIFNIVFPFRRSSDTSASSPRTARTSTAMTAVRSRGSGKIFSKTGKASA